ncbi:MAG: hypothetical protein HOP07_11895 [Bacteriovoracaceae bacterium]|nr:hypothetical protein [Bacteriovoracaceae bacterium]
MKLLLSSVLILASFAAFGIDKNAKDVFCFCEIQRNMENQFSLYRVTIISSENSPAQKIQTLIDMYFTRVECLQNVTQHPSCKISN